MTESCAKLIARGGWGEDAALGRCHFPIGPRNTASNIFYPLAGVALVLRDPDPSSWTVLAALTLLGVGSAAYHGFKTIVANGFDWAGMYATFTSLAVLAWAPRAPWQAAAFTGFFALWVGLVMSFKKGMRFDWHMGVLFLIAAVPTIVSGDRLLAIGGVVCFALGYLCWQLDKRRSPLVGLFGHSLWHAATAVGTGMLALAR